MIRCVGGTYDSTVQPIPPSYPTDINPERRIPIRKISSTDRPLTFFPALIDNDPSATRNILTARDVSQIYLSHQRSNFPLQKGITHHLAEAEVCLEGFPTKPVS